MKSKIKCSRSLGILRKILMVLDIKGHLNSTFLQKIVSRVQFV